MKSKSISNKKLIFLENNWKNTWCFRSKYFSYIPPLVSKETASFLKFKKKTKLIKKIKRDKINKNLIEILFGLDIHNVIKLKWIYIKNRYKNIKKDDNSWESIFNTYSRKIIKNDDYLWIGAKYSRCILNQSNE